MSDSRAHSTSPAARRTKSDQGVGQSLLAGFVVAAACIGVVACKSPSAESAPEASGLVETAHGSRSSASMVAAAGVSPREGDTPPQASVTAAPPSDTPVIADDGAIVVAAERSPIDRRIARQTITVHASPNANSAVRGRIPMSMAFEIFAEVDGPGCEAGWADVGSHGFACLNRSRPGGKKELQVLPELRDRDLMPYYYAKVRASVAARRWKSLAAYRAKAAPIDTLEKGHDYAFVTRRLYKGELVLIDDQRRVVLESEVLRYRPARFQGRDLETDPVQTDGARLGWIVNWPHAPAYASPSKTALLREKLDYHRELELLGEPVENGDGRWYQVADDVYAHEDDVRVYTPATELPPDVGESEVWLDIDLSQQTLAVMRGMEPSYVTLVSSGFKGPTPRGIFRIHLKQAVGSMQSTPGADDFYNVEAVPFVQYFLGGFALHTAYWHNAFGRPISHGCVNLSPIDANRVFSMTTPALRPGWLHGYETEQHLGTTVQIRKGAGAVRDRRAEVESVFLGSAQ